MIANLSLAVSLCRGGESVGDLIFGTETCHLLAGEFCPVVGDDGMRKPNVTYNVLPEELNYPLSCDIRWWHRFPQLDEVVHSYQ